MSESSNIVDKEAIKAELSTNTIRVLLVDSDSDSLLCMSNLMSQFSYYQVNKFTDGEEAIDFLKNNKHEIDLVIWDFHVRKINGLEALNIIVKEMDLPVVTMASTDYKNEMVLDSIKYGSCDFILKPVCKEVIAVLWRHVLRKRIILNSGLGKPEDELESDPDDEPNTDDESDHNEQDSRKESNRNNLEVSKNTTSYEIGESSKSSSKKLRMTWTTELHEKFVQAYNILDKKQKAYPKEILKYMQKELNITQKLTRNNVASHLQKFRLHQNKTKTDEEEEDNGWRKGELATVSNMNLHGTYVMNDRAHVLTTPAQYSSNGYIAMNNNPFMMTNPLPCIDQFQLLQQQQQQEYYNVEDLGHVSSMENSIQLIYNATLPHDYTEYFPKNFNFDSTPRNH